MRWLVLVALVFVAGCDDEIEGLYYGDGSEWQNVSLPPTRIPPGEMNLREFAQWSQAATALPDRDIRTYTPGVGDWVGWSVNPSGGFKYIDAGSFVLLWTDDELTGTSNLGGFAVVPLPANLRPSQTVHAASPACIDNSLFVGCFAQITSGGTLAMFNMNTTTFTYGNNWTAAGTKGWPRGWSIMYRR